MIDPSPTDVGRTTYYPRRGPTRGSGWCNDIYQNGQWRHEESGVVTSYNEHYVFVRFNGCTSAACRRQDLYWEPTIQ